MKAKSTCGAWSIALLKTLTYASLGLSIAGTALADDQDADALSLADQTPASKENAKDWKIFLEGEYGTSTMRDGDSNQENHRLSLDVAYDKTFAPGWRVVFADRLDMDWPAPVSDQNSINTLKDAYLSWQVEPSTILDLGRINVRYGVAVGYNPTDFFRTGALRSIVSVDPISLKENRQGSVMLRTQNLWDSGSITALYSPRLTDSPNYDGFDPSWSSTNNQGRFLVAVSQKVSANLNPQFLLYKEDGESAQLGFNLTSLLGDSAVAFVEWSGGRSASLLTQALDQQGLPGADDTVFRNHLAAGLTYTTSNKISLTAELEYNGAGQDQTAWNNIGNGSPAIYGLYRNWLEFTQEPPTKQAAMFYGTWQDALINHLDLSAMERFDADDYSRLSWLEARYHMEHAEFALQWQRNSGPVVSDYGAAPQIQSWQAVVRYYF